MSSSQTDQRERLAVQLDPTGLTASVCAVESVNDALERDLKTPNWQSRLALGLLSRLSKGRLRITLPGGQRYVFEGRDATAGPEADLSIHHWSAFSKAISRGDIGFGEAYMEGDWSSDDLPSLLWLLALNRQNVASALYGNRLFLWLDRLQHLFRSNTKRRSKRNIQAHYDLGNDFYQLWLDASMTYSSAIFDGSGAWHHPVSLERGQSNKIQRALDELNGGRLLNDQSTTLEIGCGWGSLAAERLNRYRGNHVGLTLSPAQKDWAEKTLSKQNLSDRVDFRLQDYRDVDGQFDGIVSIEMIEAVGEAFWPTYFQTIKKRLKPSGRAVIQAIIIKDELFPRYRQGTDFIQKYIFPGGMLLTEAVIAEQASNQGLRVCNQYFFGADYARTLREWLNRFDEANSEVKALGFDDRFIAMWRFYLAYCEAGFRVGDLNVVQVTLSHSEETT